MLVSIHLCYTMLVNIHLCYSMLVSLTLSGVGGATKGTLVFMVGGDKKCYDQSVSLLECMGQAAIHCGQHGAGQAAKLCNNMLLAISTLGTCEALQLGIRYVCVCVCCNCETFGQHCFNYLYHFNPVWC